METKTRNISNNGEAEVEAERGPSKENPLVESPTQTPRDGPATVFEADPMVSDIFTGSDGDYFGLVLVTNWPVSPLAAMDYPYQDFLGAVKSCFWSEDIGIAAPLSKSADIPTPVASASAPLPLPAVYLYPTPHLHITLATFVSPTKLTDITENRRNARKREALELMQSASKLPGWPTEPLRLIVDSAQIGTKAGILLWKDTSGGVAAIRNCLARAMVAVEAKANSEVEAKTPATATEVPRMRIPGIIHSTFLRFSRIPQTPGGEVQEKFRSKILGKIGSKFFGTGDKNGNGNENENTPFLLQANTMRLVLESTPYMHIPNDDEHVLWTCELTK